jgi:hypothetical protein
LYSECFTRNVNSIRKRLFLLSKCKIWKFLFRCSFWWGLSFESRLRSFINKTVYRIFWN